MRFHFLFRFCREQFFKFFLELLIAPVAEAAIFAYPRMLVKGEISGFAFCSIALFVFMRTKHLNFPESLLPLLFLFFRVERRVFELYYFEVEFLEFRANKPASLSNFFGSKFLRKNFYYRAFYSLQLTFTDTKDGCGLAER